MTVQDTAKRIKDLEIQGARNVAIAAIESVENLARQTKARDKTEFLEEISEAKRILFATRETEPLMRNAIRWIISQLDKSREKKVKKLTEIVSSSSRQFLKDLEHSKDRIAEIGARRIRRGCVVLTHCHSSTVTHLLKRAVQEGKTFEVICTETRPLFQGRTTAK